MKLISLPVLCLSVLLFHTYFSLAKKGGKKNTSNQGSTHKNNHGSSSKTNQRGHHDHGSHGGYSGHGTHGRNGGHGSHGRYGSVGGRGSPSSHHYGGYGGYQGGYINHNPNNKILSPRYGGSFGYGGHGVGGGSPFSHSVQAMGMFPSDKSRGYGRRAVMAAGGGAMAGMAVGYGLGRFPRSHFQFHSPQEEYYYNNYMYRKYSTKSTKSTKSTDTNDYSRDFSYSPPPETYDSYMDSCMNRTDLLLVENRQTNNKPAANTTTITTVVTSAPDTGTGSNTAQTNGTAAENSSTSVPSTPFPLNESEVNPTPPAPQVLRETVTDDDDDTVSIVEIGYPALVKQLKVRRCLELYMVYSENNGVQGPNIGSQRLSAVVTITMLILLNSNVIMLLY